MKQGNVLHPSDGVDPQVRARVLASVYQTILSWKKPGEKETELAIDNLGGEPIASSEAGSPTVVDEVPTNNLSSSNSKKKENHHEL